MLALAQAKSLPAKVYARELELVPMGCGASSAVPVGGGVDAKHWPAIIKLMDDAERQRARAIAAEARLRQLQRLVAEDSADRDLRRPALPKGFGGARSANRLDGDMRRHAATSDWWWMADNEASLTLRPSDAGPPSAPQPPSRRRAVLPPLEPLEG